MKNFQKSISCLLFLGLISGCATSQKSAEEMKYEMGGFTIPQRPRAGKGLVYFVYGGIPFCPESEVELFYSKSTPEKLEEQESTTQTLLGLFTFGLTKSPPALEKTFIGSLKIRQYITLELDPGIYEFNRRLAVPCYNAKLEGTRQVKIEPGQVHYVEINENFNFNRYSGNFDYYVSMFLVKDPTIGKYSLFRNFNLGSQT